MSACATAEPPVPRTRTVLLMCFIADNPWAQANRTTTLMTTKIPAASPAVIRPRIYLGPKLSLGPGKIDLLRAVSETGSISSAARTLGMSYKRAWVLLDAMNQGFGRPVLEALAGGRGGGGARLTPLGQAIIRHYLRMETKCQATIQPDIVSLKRLLARGSP